MENKKVWYILIAGSLIIFLGIIVGIGDFMLIENMERADLVPFGISFFGILIVVLSVIKIIEEKSKSAKQKIDEEDERNIKISNMAKSKVFNLIFISLPVLLITLAAFGFMTKVTFFSLTILYLVYFFYFIYQLQFFKKQM